MTIAAIIVAAGSGSRLGGEIPKQYLHVGDQPILEYSLQALSSHPKISHVAVVVSDEHTSFNEKILKKYGALTVLGGTSRSDSVKSGLDALMGNGITKVLVHDAARPFLSHEVTNRVIVALENEMAVIPVLPVVDTIKSGELFVSETVDRSVLNRVQTPQGFDYKTLMQAYRDLQSFTDDAQAMEQKNIPVSMVAGDEYLFKVTTAHDHMVAEALVNEYVAKRDF